MNEPNSVSVKPAAGQWTGRSTEMTLWSSWQRFAAGRHGHMLADGARR